MAGFDNMSGFNKELDYLEQIEALEQGVEEQERAEQIAQVEQIEEGKNVEAVPIMNKDVVASSLNEDLKSNEDTNVLTKLDNTVTDRRDEVVGSVLVNREMFLKHLSMLRAAARKDYLVDNLFWCKVREGVIGLTISSLQSNVDVDMNEGFTCQVDKLDFVGDFTKFMSLLSSIKDESISLNVSKNKIQVVFGDGELEFLNYIDRRDEIEQHFGVWSASYNKGLGAVPLMRLYDSLLFITKRALEDMHPVVVFGGDGWVQVKSRSSFLEYNLDTKLVEKFGVLTNDSVGLLMFLNLYKQNFGTEAMVEISLLEDIDNNLRYISFSAGTGRYSVYYPALKEDDINLDSSYKVQGLTLERKRFLNTIDVLGIGAEASLTFLTMVKRGSGEIDLVVRNMMSGTTGKSQIGITKSDNLDFEVSFNYKVYRDVFNKFQDKNLIFDIGDIKEDSMVGIVKVEEKETVTSENTENYTVVRRRVRLPYRVLNF